MTLQSKQAAKAFLEKMLPEVTVEEGIFYREVYVFRVDLELDPFFAVDPLTNVIQEFSVLEDGDISEIAELFEAEAQTEGGD